MRTFTKFLAASAFALSAASVAKAADAIDEIPMAPESVQVVESGNWEGAYVGGKLTHQWGKTKEGKNYDATGFGGGRIPVARRRGFGGVKQTRRVD